MPKGSYLSSAFRRSKVNPNMISVPDLYPDEPGYDIGALDTLLFAGRLFSGPQIFASSLTVDKASDSDDAVWDFSLLRPFVNLKNYYSGAYQEFVSGQPAEATALEKIYLPSEYLREIRQNIRDAQSNLEDFKYLSLERKQEWFKTHLYDGKTEADLAVSNYISRLGDISDPGSGASFLYTQKLLVDFENQHPVKGALLSLIVDISMDTLTDPLSFFSGGRLRKVPEFANDLVKTVTHGAGIAGKFATGDIGKYISRLAGYAARRIPVMGNVAKWKYERDLKSLLRRYKGRLDDLSSFIGKEVDDAVRELNLPSGAPSGNLTDKLAAGLKDMFPHALDNVNDTGSVVIKSIFNEIRGSIQKVVDTDIYGKLDLASSAKIRTAISGYLTKLYAGGSFDVNVIEDIIKKSGDDADKFIALLTNKLFQVKIDSIIKKTVDSARYIHMEPAEGVKYLKDELFRKFKPILNMEERQQTFRALNVFFNDLASGSPVPEMFMGTRPQAMRDMWQGTKEFPFPYDIFDLVDTQLKQFSKISKSKIEKITDMADDLVTFIDDNKLLFDSHIGHGYPERIAQFIDDIDQAATTDPKKYKGILASFKETILDPIEGFFDNLDRSYSMGRDVYISPLRKEKLIEEFGQAGLKQIVDNINKNLATNTNTTTIGNEGVGRMIKLFRGKGSHFFIDNDDIKIFTNVYEKGGGIIAIVKDVDWGGFMRYDIPLEGLGDITKYLTGADLVAPGANWKALAKIIDKSVNPINIETYAGFIRRTLAPITSWLKSSMLFNVFHFPRFLFRNIIDDTGKVFMNSDLDEFAKYTVRYGKNWTRPLQVIEEGKDTLRLLGKSAANAEVATIREIAGAKDKGAIRKAADFMEKVYTLDFEKLGHARPKTFASLADSISRISLFQAIGGEDIFKQIDKIADKFKGRSDIMLKIKDFKLGLGDAAGLEKALLGSETKAPIDLLKKLSKDLDDKAKYVKHTLYDIEELTDMEEDINSVLLFYRFMRYSFMWNVKAMLKHPLKYKNTVRLFSAAFPALSGHTNIMTKAEEEDMPGWLKNSSIYRNYRNVISNKILLGGELYNTDITDEDQVQAYGAVLLKDIKEPVYLTGWGFTYEDIWRTFGEVFPEVKGNDTKMAVFVKALAGLGGVFRDSITAPAEIMLTLGNMRSSLILSEKNVRRFNTIPAFESSINQVLNITNSYFGTQYKIQKIITPSGRISYKIPAWLAFILRNIPPFSVINTANRAAVNYAEGGPYSGETWRGPWQPGAKIPYLQIETAIPSEYMAR